MRRLQGGPLWPVIWHITGGSDAAPWATPLLTASALKEHSTAAFFSMLLFQYMYIVISERASEMSARSKVESIPIIISLFRELTSGNIPQC